MVGVIRGELILVEPPDRLPSLGRRLLEPGLGGIGLGGFSEKSDFGPVECLRFSLSPVYAV